MVYKSFKITHGIHYGDIDDPKMWEWVAYPIDLFRINSVIKETTFYDNTLSGIKKQIDNTYKKKGGWIK